MLSELFAAIDVGTTNTKVAVFDEDGSRVCLRQVRCSAVVKNGIHEVNPENWWRAVTKAFLDIDEQIRDRICSMSITGQGPTIVAVNENGSPHGHAITWLDKRKSELSDELKEDNSIDEQEKSVLLKLQWLKEHIGRRVFLLQPSDFLQLKLTGSLVNATFPIEGFLPWRK
ncbi:MAG: carbohydrate kinase, partial [Thermotogae bacterium]